MSYNITKNSEPEHNHPGFQEAAETFTCLSLSENSELFTSHTVNNECDKICTYPPKTLPEPHTHTHRQTQRRGVCVCGSLRPAVVLIRSSGLFVPSHLSESWRCQLRRLRCRNDVTFPPRPSSNNRGTAQPSLPPPHAVIHTHTPAQIPEVCRRKKMEELHTQAEKSCFLSLIV